MYETEAEAPILWPPTPRTDSVEKTLRLGKIEGRRRRGQQRMRVGWHHQLNRHEFEQALGDGEGQGSLASCSWWGPKESNMTELLNKNQMYVYTLQPC